MSVDEEGSPKRLEEAKDELWEMRQALDRAIRNPETSEEEMGDLLATHSVVVFEYKSLYQRKVEQVEQLLETLKSCNMIDDYARASNWVHLRVDSTELTMTTNEVLPFLQGLVKGRDRSLDKDVETRKIELPGWVKTNRFDEQRDD